MTVRRRGALAAGLSIVALAIFLLLARGGEKPAAQKPRLLLLTRLPVLFGEGFSLDSARSPLLDELGKTHEVTAIDRTDAASLARGRMLVMAQPRAQTAENLIALDSWVRAGGRLVLFADPRLDWPSELPLGDLNRPPPMFADTGLLGHWGLRLDAPDKAGPAEALLEARAVTTSSPGRLVRTGGDCTIADGGLTAHCSLGAGQAIVVADADLLARAGNLDAVAELIGDGD